MKKTIYEVDAAMLGKSFKRDPKYLIIFCQYLQELTGEDIEIKPITDSWNGAATPDKEIVNDVTWHTAIDYLCRNYHEAWDE